MMAAVSPLSNALSRSAVVGTAAAADRDGEIGVFFHGTSSPDPKYLCLLPANFIPRASG
jgi:hypothetical protein